MPCLIDDTEKCMIALPMAETRIEPSWDSVGMKGSGSDTVVIEEVTIDDEQINRMMPPEQRPASAYPREATDRWIAFPLLRVKTFGLLVGIAEAMLEAVIALRQRPVIYSAYDRREDSAVWQAGVGQAAGMIGVVRTVLEKHAGQIDDAARRGHVPTYAERAAFRGESATASTILIDAVEKLMNLAGSSAYSAANPLQRYWRDFSVGMRHIVFNIELGHEVFGRQLMGLDPKVVLPDFV